MKQKKTTVPTGCFYVYWMRPKYFPFSLTPHTHQFFFLLFCGNPHLLFCYVPSTDYLYLLPHSYFFLYLSPHCVCVLYVGYPIDWLVGSRGYQDQKLFSGSFFYPPKYIFTEKNFLPLSPLYNYLPSFTLSKGKKQKTKNKKHSTMQKKIIWKKSLNGTRDHFFLSTTYVTMDNTTQWLSGGACWWSRLISRINVVFFFPLLWKGDRVIKKTFFLRQRGMLSSFFETVTSCRRYGWLTNHKEGLFVPKRTLPLSKRDWNTDHLSNMFRRLVILISTL